MSRNRRKWRKKKWRRQTLKNKEEWRGRDGREDELQREMPRVREESGGRQ